MPKQTQASAAKKHRIVSQKEWIAARKKLLTKEKKFTRLRDQLSRERRKLPWEPVSGEYLFDGPGGRKSLSDLFGGKSQLIVYHFMFAPEASEGCPHCSFWADHYDGMVAHLRQRDVSFVAISRAPVGRIEQFKQRMGWKFRWYSSGGNQFNYDYGVSFRPEDFSKKKVFYNYSGLNMQMADREGISVFYKNDSGEIFHTYSCYARGIDMVNTTYQFLDLAPKGRDEDSLPDPQAWVRYHDRYGEN